MTKYNKAIVAAVGAALTAAAPILAAGAAEYITGVIGILATALGTYAVRNSE